ncbi:MAG: hypothetical protein AAGH46_05480, partial [Bacteroidota bacterium]
QNLLFKWFLVLYAFEVYAESEDILKWSKEINVRPEDYLEYYKGLNYTYNSVQTLIGDFDACISSFDYTLRTGVIKELENWKDFT